VIECRSTVISMRRIGVEAGGNASPLASGTAVLRTFVVLASLTSHALHHNSGEKQFHLFSEIF
jgi:hypothetical protein